MFIYFSGKTILRKGQKVEGANLVPQKSHLLYIVELLKEKKNPGFMYSHNFINKSENKK